MSASTKQESSLIIFERAAIMLAEADTIQKAKELKSLALTAADWAKRKGMGEAAIQHCRSYALEAERKMGEMLAQSERAKPGPQKADPLHDVRDLSPTLKDLGITYRESSEAQKLAALPKPVFEAVRDGKETKTKVFRAARREAVVKTVATLPSKKYRVLYADPPWKYGDSRDGLPGTTGASAHYPSLSISELCALPVIEISEDNAVMFLWVTSPLLFDCAPLIKAWGFTYKASFVWDKVKHNLGHYNSVRHEFLLVCTRGSCVPDVMKLHDSVQSIERTEHSRKPEKFREIIDEIYPHGKRIELFARTKTKGWDAYGNEC